MGPAAHNRLDTAADVDPSADIGADADIGVDAEQACPVQISGLPGAGTFEMTRLRSWVRPDRRRGQRHPLASNRSSRSDPRGLCPPSGDRRSRRASDRRVRGARRVDCGQRQCRSRLRTSPGRLSPYLAWREGLEFLCLPWRPRRSVGFCRRVIGRCRTRQGMTRGPRSKCRRGTGCHMQRGRRRSVAAPDEHRGRHPPLRHGSTEWRTEARRFPCARSRMPYVLAEIVAAMARPCPIPAASAPFARRGCCCRCSSELGRR